MTKEQKWELEDFQVENPELGEVAWRLARAGDYTVDSIIETVREAFTVGIMKERSREMARDEFRLSPEEKLLIEKMNITREGYLKVKFQEAPR